VLTRFEYDEKHSKITFYTQQESSITCRVSGASFPSRTRSPKGRLRASNMMGKRQVLAGLFTSYTQQFRSTAEYRVSGIFKNKR